MCCIKSGGNLAKFSEFAVGTEILNRLFGDTSLQWWNQVSIGLFDNSCGNSYQVLKKIAEQKIRDYIDSGGLSNLGLKGKRLDLSRDRHVPPEVRALYRILKNSGDVPPEVSLLREISQLSKTMEQEPDLKRRFDTQRRKEKLNILLEFGCRYARPSR